MALMKLDLSHNQLRASFGAALADALKYTPALIQLNLRHNGLGVEGGVSVVALLELQVVVRAEHHLHATTKQLLVVDQEDSDAAGG